MDSTADFLVLRSPLLAYDDLATWSSGLEAPGAVDDPERPSGLVTVRGPDTISDGAPR